MNNSLSTFCSKNSEIFLNIELEIFSKNLVSLSLQHFQSETVIKGNCVTNFTTVKLTFQRKSHNV